MNLSYLYNAIKKILDEISFHRHFKRVFSKAIVLTIKPCLVVRECTASMGGLVVRTVVLGEPNITATYNFPRMQDFTISPVKRVPGPPNMLYH